MKQSFDQWWNDEQTQRYKETCSVESIAKMAWFAAIEPDPVVYGCHCDLEPGQAPDGCVLLGDGDYCIYANSLRKAGKTVADCEYWRPIK